MTIFYFGEEHEDLEAGPSAGSGRLKSRGLFFGFVGVEWLGEVGGSEPQNVELINFEFRRVVARLRRGFYPMYFGVGFLGKGLRTGWVGV